MQVKNRKKKKKKKKKTKKLSGRGWLISTTPLRTRQRSGIMESGNAAARSTRLHSYTPPAVNGRRHSPFVIGVAGGTASGKVSYWKFFLYYLIVSFSRQAFVER